jgi:hypothetical protein
LEYNMKYCGLKSMDLTRQTRLTKPYYVLLSMGGFHSCPLTP